MYLTASDTVTIPVEFKSPEGQLVVPDAGSFNYIVIRLDGTFVQPIQTPTLGATNTETVITLSSPTTDMVGATDFETLRVRYQYAVKGTTIVGREDLKITPELKYTVSTEEVRNLLGATDLVLPDESIDLYSRYLTLKYSPLLNEIDYDALLVQGGYASQQANEALKYAAAISAITVLRYTSIKTHTEDNISVTHFEADLDLLSQQMIGKFYAALSALNPVFAQAITLSPDFFVVANPDPDVVTGET